MNRTRSIPAASRINPTGLVCGLVLGAALFTLSGCATKRYFARGLVLDIQQPSGLTVSHDRIPGLMDPMVMSLSVRDPALLEGVRRGHRIHFQLAVGNKETHIDRLTIVSAAPDPSASQDSAAGQQPLAPGQPVPDFELWDQNGVRVSLSSFRGKLVVVNFIYTRCPLPDYCPRATANLQALKRRFSASLGRDLVLLTVTFDPLFDTPEVLHAYAKSFGVLGPGWHFLTGAGDQIARLCSLFGLQYWPDEGAFTHNLQTGLIDRRGLLAATVEGQDYTARQLGDLVERLLVEPSGP